MEENNQVIHNEKVFHKDRSRLALIAGGLGFLGSHLAEVLLSQNCHVLCIDILTPENKQNLKALLSKKNFSFIEHDLNKSLPNLPSGIDYVFHLAGFEDYPDDNDVNMETLLVNSVATRNLLELSKATGAKFLLVSSIDTYSGFSSDAEFSQYFDFKGQKTKHYSHYEAKKFSEALVWEYARKFNLDCRIVRLADVYGPRMNLESETDLPHLFKEIKTENFLTVDGDGLKILHPTFISDVVYGLAKAVFLDETKGKTYNLANPQDVTCLNFAYQVQKKSGKYLDVKFNEKSAASKSPVPKIELTATQQELGWRPTVPIDIGIERTLEWLVKNEGATDSFEEKTTQSLREVKLETTIPVPSITTKKISWQLPALKLKNPASWRFWLLVFCLGLIFIKLLFPVGDLFFSLGWAAINLENSQKQVLNQDFNAASVSAKKAAASFKNSQEQIESLTWLTSLLGLRRQAGDLEDLSATGESISGAIYHVASSAKPLLSATKIISGQDEESLLLKINEAKLELDLAADQLAKSEAQLKNLEGKKFIWDKIDQTLAALKKELPANYALINQIRSTVRLLPEITGLLGRRTYLLLFQNNMELRPTGGFIGSYGLLTMENGKLVDFKIEDVYAADGQLKENIEPPAKFKEGLGQSRWYLRDSNWDPDFPASAKMAESFLEKETGRKVDGVIGLDLSLMEGLLEALGSIDLPDYKETVTAENIFEKAEYYSEIGFFPGSTQKKDFLASLNNRLFDQMFKADETKWLAILKSLSRSLNERHLMVYLHQNQAAKILSDQNWDGHIKSVSKENDYLMMSEANVGANKANYFLNRKMNLEVYLGKEGEIDHRLMINLDNQSPNETWPAGRYKSYLRIYVPLGAKLKNVEVGDNREVTKVDVSEDKDKTIFGFFVEIKPQTKKNIVVEWGIPQKLIFVNGKARYQLLFQKQPGTNKDPLVLTINHPLYAQLISSHPLGVAKEQAIDYNTDLLTDREFKIELTK